MQEMAEKEVISFNSLYSNYYRKSFLFTKSYVHDDLVAEDIASEVLLKLYNLLKTEYISPTPALLLTMLKYKSLDHLRHQQVREEAISSIMQTHQRELEMRVATLQACDPDEIFSSEIEQIVTKTLASLPAQTRRVFELSRFEYKSNKEIAEELGISVKGVEYQIAKALKVMRVQLKDYLYFSFLFLS